MEKEKRIHHLKNILKSVDLTEEENEALKSAIEILKNNGGREQLIEVAKILAALVNVGVKIFH